jgi:protein-tyrosine phosphatase
MNPESREQEINLRILIVCTGNLCRSPFAEHLLRRRLLEKGLDDIAVASAGVSAPVGTACPKEILLAGSEWDVDLRAHRAHQLRAEDLLEADLVLTLEPFHRISILTAFPVLEEKLHPLTQFEDESASEGIDDPMGKDIEATRAIFGRIALCVENVADYYADGD